MSMVDRLPQPRLSFGIQILEGGCRARGDYKRAAIKRSRLAARPTAAQLAEMLELDYDPPCQPVEDVFPLPVLSRGLGAHVRRVRETVGA